MRQRQGRERKRGAGRETEQRQTEVGKGSREVIVGNCELCLWHYLKYAHYKSSSAQFNCLDVMRYVFFLNCLCRRIHFYNRHTVVVRQIQQQQRQQSQHRLGVAQTCKGSYSRILSRCRYRCPLSPAADTNYAGQILRFVGKIRPAS